MPRPNVEQETKKSLQIVMKTLISKYGQGDDTMVIKNPERVSKSGSKTITLSEKFENRFTSEENIGAGGMKVINLVKDENMKRVVAKASIHPERMTEQNIEMFIREARLTAALEHPNIIPIYEIGQNKKGEPFFIMKHLDGFNLKQLLVIIDQEDEEAIENFPLEKLLKIFLEICRATAYAHENQILHLDLKPDNIHISSEGKVYVVDWGLSKIIGEKDFESSSKIHDLIEDNIDHTMSGELKGTPGYMATEQINKKKQLTQQTDIYGLGGILYSIICREIPISESDIEKNLIATLRGKITLPSQRRPDIKVDKELERITMKAMQRLPKNRYHTVEDLIFDIEKHLEKSNRSYKKLFFAFSMVAILLVGVALAFYFLKDRFLEKKPVDPEPKQPIVVQPKEKVVPKYKIPSNPRLSNRHQVGMWRMDKQEGHKFIDSSVYKHEGYLKHFNDDIWIPGVINEAIDFSVMKSYVEVPYFGVFPEKQVAVSAWIYLHSHKDWSRIIMHNWSGRQKGWILMTNAKGEAVFALKDGHTFHVRAEKLELKKWYHVAGVYNGNTLTIYLNGRKADSMKKLNTVFSRNGHMYISANHGDYFDGVIDELRLYNKALSLGEVQELYYFGSDQLKNQ